MESVPSLLLVPLETQVKCALTKRKKKKVRAKRVGVGHPQMRVFKRFLKRGEENQHWKCVEKGEWKAEAAPRQASSCLL